MSKYASLDALVQAYRNGEVTEPLSLDNDDTYVTVPEDPDWIRAETVFRAHPHDLLEEALTLLGIPWEHV